MGKLTWNSIGRIYGSEFGLTPKEAAQIISDHIFSKNWYGTKQSPGRMWQDQETCRALCILLSEIGKYEKKNKVKFKTSLKQMWDQKDKAIALFMLEAKVGIKNFDTFYNKMMFWKKLPFVFQQPKKLSAAYKNRKVAAQKKLKKVLKLKSDAEKQLLLRKK